MLSAAHRMLCPVLCPRNAPLWCMPQRQRAVGRNIQEERNLRPTTRLLHRSDILRMAVKQITETYVERPVTGKNAGAACDAASLLISRSTSNSIVESHILGPDNAASLV